jgi:tetratricopeptide (TPR) repeat protein
LCESTRTGKNASFQRDPPALFIQGDHAFNHATLDEVFGHFRAAETTVQHLLKAEPDAPRSQRDLSVSYNKIGEVQRAQGDLPSAISSYKQGLEIRQKLAARDPANTQWKTDLVISLWKLASVLEQQGAPQKGKAGVNYERALEILRRLAAENRLTADQKTWISQLEARVKAITGEDTKTGLSGSPR